MLTLMRQEGEVICIGDDIRIEVRKVGTKVKLAVFAPVDVQVIRQEALQSRIDARHDEGED